MLQPRLDTILFHGPANLPTDSCMLLQSNTMHMVQLACSKFHASLRVVVAAPWSRAPRELVGKVDKGHQALCPLPR